MKIAIMQPYFMPYIGYFQLINAVDNFVIYDDIEYTKKGWINRNRILQNGKDVYISLPLKKDSDYLQVKQRFLSDNWAKDKIKLINKIAGCYQKAPYFSSTFPLIEKILSFEDANLFKFIEHSLKLLLEHLNITTPIVKSSSLTLNQKLKSQEKVLEICSHLNASHYVNPIGGTTLYNKQIFMAQNIELSFLRTTDFTYPQFNNEHVKFLSILDVLMFNDIQAVNSFIENKFSLV